MRLSPEGDRIAFSIESDGGAQSGVAIIGICRDHDGSVAGLSQAFALVSTQSNVSMMTFYNDVTFSMPRNTSGGVRRSDDVRWCLVLKRVRRYPTMVRSYGHRRSRHISQACRTRPSRSGENGRRIVGWCMDDC